MRKLLAFQFLVLFTVALTAQNKPAYKLYNTNGKKVTYKKMLRTLAKADVVLFGEFHNNPISHWLQYEVTQDLFKTKPLTLGAEMFERDNQEQLTSYVKGTIDAKALDSTARLWNNFKTDYKPLVDFAKKNKLNFVATNIPRRYASKVFRGGFEVLEQLSDKEKEWIAPLPVKYDANLPGYKKMLSMMGGHGGENLPKAQAIKDATMSYSILQNLEKGKIFVHYNGAYHSNHFEGIYWYLKQANPNLKIVTISTVEFENPKKFDKEQKDLADFIIAVSKTMTKTY